MRHPWSFHLLPICPPYLPFMIFMTESHVYAPCDIPVLPDLDLAFMIYLLLITLLLGILSLGVYNSCLPCIQIGIFISHFK